jgi:hypothetical protein
MDETDTSNFLKSKSFLAYFGFYSNVFFGNVGRYADIYFPERGEVFDMENALEENLCSNGNVSEPSANNNKKIEKFQKLQKTNATVYKARLQKLLLTHDHLFKVLEKDKKNRENIAQLFQKFFIELQTLQENFKYQRDAIIRNHMIDMFGHFEDADDKSYDYRNVNILDFI